MAQQYKQARKSSQASARLPVRGGKGERQARNASIGMAVNHQETAGQAG
ncbi:MULTISPECIES: hypothetical protein [unclassified Janthinobacterium]|nr:MULTISPECIES: hypothetical protein [unclassified Janthinobacterium]MDN2713158.1 hypothetical protein [Janthinobacterium sp. SUN118]